MEQITKERIKITVVVMILIISGILFILPAIHALPLCQEQTDVYDIPCLGLTKVLNCSGTISVTNLNTSQNFNLATTPIGGNIYNFTFPFNQSSYSLVACDSSTATMVVGYFAGGFGFTQLSLMVPEIIIIFLFVGLGWFLSKKDSSSASGYAFSVGAIIFGYMVILFMVGTVSANIQNYIPFTNTINLYQGFYVGLLWIFFAMVAMQVSIFLIMLVQKIKIKRGKGNEDGLAD